MYYLVLNQKHLKLSDVKVVHLYNIAFVILLCAIFCIISKKHIMINSCMFFVATKCTAFSLLVQPMVESS